MSEFLGTVLIIFVLWFGGTLILNHHSSIDAAGFIFYLVILYSIINPLKDFSKATYNIPKGLASMERIDRILLAENKMIISSNPISLKKIESKIEYRNVSFRYGNKDEKWVLKNIDITIEKVKA